MKILFPLLTLLIIACGPRPTSIQTKTLPESESNFATDGPIKSIKGFASPESVIGIDTIVFVSNIGKELFPKTKDGDGFISKLGLSGAMLNKGFITGLDAPKGMAIWDSVLFIADIDQVRAYNWETGDSLDLFDFAPYKASFLNDLCRGDSGFLYVSETLNDKLFRVDVYRRDKKNSPIAPITIPKDAQVNGINGLWYDEAFKDLYMVGFGNGDSANGSIAVIPFGPRATAPRRWITHRGKLDGVAMINQHIYVTDWSGFETGEPFWDIDLSTLTSKPVRTGAIGGPADFWYNPKKQQFWIPSITENKIYITNLSQ